MNEHKFLKYFKQFVDEINLENGRNYKLSILEKYKDNDCVKYFLQQIYDPYLVFGISDKKLNKNVGHQSGVIWLDYPEDSVIFEYLKDHNTGTDKDIWTVQQFRKAHISENYRDLFDSIVTKNLHLGIDTTTINKVIPSLCRTFNVMLANKYFDDPSKVEGKMFALTTKIDGMRCIMLKENGNVTFWSRQGQQIEGLVDLEEESKYFPDNICLDGELVAISDNSDTYRQTMKLARTKDTEKHGLKMKVFDYLPIDDFKNQNCALSYAQRQEHLNIIWGRHYKSTIYQCAGQLDLFLYGVGLATTDVVKKTAFKYFELLPILYKGNDESVIVKILNEQISNGEEGIMINICDAPYEFKRTSNLLKVKKFKTLDLEVVGFEEGTNGIKGKLGALLVRYKDGNTVKVGSGFTNSEIYDKDGNLIHQDDRKEIWAHQKDWLGRVIEVQYFEETYDSTTGKPSLRFPVFVDYREDKLEPDF